jgi:hypothetical protein
MKKSLKMGYTAYLRISIAVMSNWPDSTSDIISLQHKKFIHLR